MKLTPERKAKLIVFLNALTLIGGVITIILLLRVIGSAAKQNADTNSKIVASQKQTEKELGCLASFFSQPNRQTLQITSLETCTVMHTDTGKSESLPLLPTSSSPAVQSSDTKQNSILKKTPTQPIATLNDNKDTSQNTALSQTASQVQAKTETKVAEPKQLLGVSICVPFTNVCARR